MGSSIVRELRTTLAAQELGRVCGEVLFGRHRVADAAYESLLAAVAQGECMGRIGYAATIAGIVSVAWIAAFVEWRFPGRGWLVLAGYFAIALVVRLVVRRPPAPASAAAPPPVTWRSGR